MRQDRAVNVEGLVRANVQRDDIGIDIWSFDVNEVVRKGIRATYDFSYEFTAKSPPPSTSSASD